MLRITLVVALALCILVLPAEGGGFRRRGGRRFGGRRFGGFRNGGFGNFNRINSNPFSVCPATPNLPALVNPAQCANRRTTLQCQNCVGNCVTAADPNGLTIYRNCLNGALQQAATPTPAECNTATTCGQTCATQNPNNQAGINTCITTTCCANVNTCRTNLINNVQTAANNRCAALVVCDNAFAALGPCDTQCNGNGQCPAGNTG